MTPGCLPNAAQEGRDSYLSSHSTAQTSNYSNYDNLCQ